MMLGQHVRTTMGQRWPNIVMLSGYIHTFLVEYNGLEVTKIELVTCQVKTSSASCKWAWQKFRKYW